MFVYDYRQVKKIDHQRRRRSMSRFEISRNLQPATRAARMGEVVEVSFPEECRHTEPMGA
ncbi:MAG: hypothetical protein PVG83_00490 [Acidimicrobiia bacterium]|jgi:hypothetical protein